MPPLVQYERFRARFEPQRRDNLQNNAADWIGKTIEWMAAWIIEPEDNREFSGQWACTPEMPASGPRPEFAWAPECDLVWEAP